MTTDNGGTGAVSSPDRLGSTVLGGLVRVLDFTHVLAGPYCSRLLADLGADVVRVETRTRPDRLGVRKGEDAVRGPSGRAPLQAHSNRNKRSVSIDLKTDEGRDVALRLVAGADVLIENFSAGVLDRLGLGWDAVHEANPTLIYLSMSGYGSDGSRHAWRSMNMNIQAHSGLMMATGSPGDPPTAIGNSWCDYIAALQGCVAVLGALEERRTTGLGARLDLSQFESNVATLGHDLMKSLVDGQPVERPGNRGGLSGFRNCYPCAGDDEWCVISADDDAQWRAFVGVLRADGVAVDAAWDDPVERRRAVDEVDRLVGGWTQVRAAEDVEATLTAAGVSAAKVARITDLLEGPSASGAFVAHRPDGDVLTLVAGLPFDFDGVDSVPLGPTPAVGAQTAEILREWVGMDASQIEALQATDALT